MHLSCCEIMHSQSYPFLYNCHNDLYSSDILHSLAGSSGNQREVAEMLHKLAHHVERVKCRVGVLIIGLNYHSNLWWNCKWCAIMKWYFMSAINKKLLVLFWYYMLDFPVIVLNKCVYFYNDLIVRVTF